MFQDILRDTEIYQLIMQEGIEKEHQKRLQDARLTIQRIVRAKFPKLESLAAKQTAKIIDTEKLQDLIISMSLSQTEKEARQYLIDGSKQDNA